MERVQTNLRKGEKGFTLVELAIVMIIIGLLITGILKGQEMIANAQVTSTISQTKAIDAAFSTFRDTFNTVPGDMTNPGVRLPALCTGTCAAAGNGDGRISINAGAVVAGEGLAAFTQMAAIDLLSGINATPLTGGANVGDEIPEAAIKGASYRLGYVGAIPTGAQGGALTTWRTGHYLAITGVPTGTAAGAAGTNALTPIQAGRIDSKSDDGNPVTGFIRAGGLGLCTAGNFYNGAGTVTNDCNVFIRIQG